MNNTNSLECGLVHVEEDEDFTVVEKDFIAVEEDFIAVAEDLIGVEEDFIDGEGFEKIIAC